MAFTESTEVNGHSWSMAEIDHIVRSAVARNLFGGADVSDLYHAAWSAVIDLYYASASAPTHHELAMEARAGIWRLAHELRRTYGYRDRDPWAGLGSAPRFAAFWGGSAAGFTPAAPYEERVLEPLALATVWGQLDERDQEIITALAACGSTVTAAAALDLPPSTFTQYLSMARRKFLALWFDHETAPKPQRSTRNHYGEVQPCGTMAAYRRHKSRGEPVDDACKLTARAHERARKRTK